MNEAFAKVLQQHETIDPSEPRMAPVSEVLSACTRVPLSEGLQARVWHLPDQGCVMKEGRWDLKLHLAEGTKLPLHARGTETILSQFGFYFLPHVQQIQRQQEQYLTFARYFGSEWKNHAQCSLSHSIANDQLRVRESLNETLACELTGHHLPHQSLSRVLASEDRQHNFLPREYLLIGESVTHPGETTYYVFQEFVKGKTLHDVPLETLTADIRAQLILFLILLLRMEQETGLLPDTRPRFLATQFFQWFQKTDNIMVGENGLKCIDTRWFWNTGDNVVKRGLFIPELTLWNARKTLETLLQQSE